MAEKLKFWNWFSPWNACCLLRYTRPREPTNACCLLRYTRPREPTNARIVVTRMQDWVPEFLKIFLGWYHRTPTASRTPATSLACGRARGASAPVLGAKPWSPSTFRPWLRPCFNIPLKWHKISDQVTASSQTYKNQPYQHQYHLLIYSANVDLLKASSP